MSKPDVSQTPLYIEIDRLRAERDSARAENEWLRAEIERLRTDKDVIRSQERNTSYEANITELEAENERLQERLGPHGLEVVTINGAGHYVNEKVKAEIERLQSCLYAQESVPALYAEIARLRAAFPPDNYLTWQECVADLRRENDDLHAQLEQEIQKSRPSNEAQPAK